MWSYNYFNGTQDNIDAVRLLIADTNSLQQKFQNEEIQGAFGIQASMFQSSMFFSGNQGAFTLPSQPVSFLRVAALLLDSLASAQALNASVKQLPDIRLDATDSAEKLMEKADKYRSVEDNAGAFIILEQVFTEWGFRDRFWNQVARQTGG